MVTSYTAKYTKISSGYMGQIVEWPEVITEGKDIDECREMLKDAVGEMIVGTPAWIGDDLARFLEGDG